MSRHSVPGFARAQSGISIDADECFKNDQELKNSGKTGEYPQICMIFPKFLSS
ncbi:MAG: hypothetical protein WCI40_05055 [Verrucomicrobiota bacterium]